MINQKNKITLRTTPSKQGGLIVVQTLVFSSVVVVMIGALAGWTATTIKAGRITFNREQAFQLAEAGVDYYRWHLAHAPADYQDGTGGAGPYVHSVNDKNGDVAGEFSLEITAPALGSTLVKIKSTGASASDSAYTRTIETSVAKPSIAKYAVAGNNSMRFGAGTEIFGPIHVNGGIRFDGLAHNVVTSASTTYNDTDSDACTGNSWGVHTCISPADPHPPTAIPSRTDIFEIGRLISQPSINFAGFTADLAVLKANAQSASGFYRGSAGSGYLGYHIVLKTNDTFDLYKINSWASMGSCSTQSPNTSSWSIGTQTFQGNYAFPSNGTIFLEDHIVIDGTISSARLTITAADLIAPIVNKNIIINNDISYTFYDGTDSIGLIGQGAIMVGLISENNLKIDSALIAQNDKIGRYYFSGGSCTYKNRSVISLYGMIASFARYGFAYTDGTGYATRNITYDASLLYAPPPNFPLTSDQYQIISWQELPN